MSDWFERAVRTTGPGGAKSTDADLFGLYASFKQEVADIHGWDHAKELVALIVQALFAGAVQAGDLRAYFELTKMDMNAVNDELKPRRIDRWHSMHHYTRAYDDAERYYFPIEACYEVAWEGFAVSLYQPNKMCDVVLSVDGKAGYEVSGFYMGTSSDSRDKANMFSFVPAPRREHPSEESHNAAPTQHETAPEAEKGNETDS